MSRDETICLTFFDVGNQDADTWIPEYQEDLSSYNEAFRDISQPTAQ